MSSLIKFTQGALNPVAGLALLGALAVQVVATNGDNTGVKSWEWEWFALPNGSGFSRGVVASGQVPSYAFTPDARGTYVLILRTYDANGKVSQDRRCFAVAETSGRVIPSAGADGSSANFGGRFDGWTQDIRAYLTQVDNATSGGAPGGTGSQIQYRVDGTTFGGAANVSYNIGLVINAAGFVSFGPSAPGTGTIRFAYLATRDVLVMRDAANTVDYSFLRTASTAVSLGIKAGGGGSVSIDSYDFTVNANGGISQRAYFGPTDFSLTGASASFIAFGTAGASSGLIRLKSGSVINVIDIDNGIGGNRGGLLNVDTTTSSMSVGNAAFNSNIYGAGINITGGANVIFDAPNAVATRVGGTTYIYCTSATAAVEFGKPIGGPAVSPEINGLRLTSVAGTPVPADVLNIGTIYLTPFTSGSIALYSTAASAAQLWFRRDTPEISIGISGLTTGKNYDLFAYWTGSAVALEVGPAWTNDTTRATALARQDGVLVKSGDPTRRYVGSFRATAAALTTDTLTQRFLYNEYNQLDRYGLVTEATATWTYALTAFRQVRGVTTNRVEVLVGNPTQIQAFATSLATHTASGIRPIAGIGIDTTTANSGISFGDASSTNFASEATQSRCDYDGILSTGYHAINFLEALSAASSTTMYGTSTGCTISLRVRLSI